MPSVSCQYIHLLILAERQINRSNRGLNLTWGEMSFENMGGVGNGVSCPDTQMHAATLDMVLLSYPSSLPTHVRHLP